MSETTSQGDVLNALREFRSGVAADLTMMTANQEAHSDRAAAQDGLQLIWSFVVSDFTVTEADEELLRAAFPDELFGADPETKFRTLRETVEDSYADAWKLSASDHLCSLATACITSGVADPVRRYRDLALKLAALTCDLDRPISGKAVADIARFDAMLRRVMVLTRVAINHSKIPDAARIKELSSRMDPDDTMSFGFIRLLDDEMGPRFVRAFADQYDSEIVYDLLQEAILEDQTEQRFRAAVAVLEEP